MNERDAHYYKLNEELAVLMKQLSEEMDPKAIEKLDKQCSEKINEIRVMIRTV